jgi:uncharacterized membrane protein YdjX (TVP38/TMEM64 family)
MLSRYFGSVFVHKYLETQLIWWKSQILNHQNHLTRFIFILRLTPIFPGWFLNIAAPHINVPLKEFFIGSALGIAPTAFIYCQAGEAIAMLSSGDQIQIFTPYNLAILFGIGAIVLLSSFFSNDFIIKTE